MKNKTLMKTLSALLAVVMVICSAPLSGFVGLELPDLFGINASAATYSGSCGTNVKWSLDTSTGVLNITGTGAMSNYSWPSSVPWYSYRSSVKNVNIQKGVTSIGSDAFYKCDSLTSVTIPDSVTSIGGSAFSLCDSLTSVTIPDSVTSIGSYAFWDCVSLTSVTIPDSVTSIGSYAFAFCNSLTSVTIPDSVTSIGDYAFAWCDSLTSVTIGDSVESIGGYAFYYCDSLTDVYYTGTEAEWSKISKGSSAFPTKTNIHYDYVPSDTGGEDDTVDAELQIGADRFSFGESISGYAGDSVTGLIVYTSADYGTSSLTVTSSNANVVSVGTISHDSGDYICDENEHRATVQLNLKAKGTATITVRSPEGVSESITVTVSSNTVEITPEEQQYINEHVSFVNSNNYNNLVTNASFYNQIWQYEEGPRNFTRYAAWDVIGDVGKIMALDLPGLLETENPYDIILVDVFRDMSQKEVKSETVEKAIKGFMTAPGMYNDFLDVFKTSEAWDEDLAEPFADYLESTQKKWVNGTFITSDNFDLADYNPELYSGLQKIIKGLDTSKLSKIFSGLKNTGTIIDYIGTSGDVVYRLFDAYQKYVLAKALFETDAEVLGALQVIADNKLPTNAGDLLDDALDPYWSAITCDTAFAAVNKFLMENGFADTAGTVAYKYLVNGIVQEMAYYAIYSATGIAFNALSATYNLTYLCLDYASGLGKQTETHELMNAAALLEKELVTIVKSNATALSSNKTLNNAKVFDSTWGLLQSLEAYCYKTMATFVSAFKQEYKFNYAIHTSVIKSNLFKLIRKAQLNEDISACDAAIQTVVYLESEWKKYSCHKENNSSSKMATVKCPTDVYVYDSKGSLVLSIVNNKITFCESEITAFVDGDEKIIVLPTTEKYDIKVTATNNGTMDYGVKCFDKLDLVEVVGYNDVALTNKKSYYAEIPKELSADADEYNLVSESGVTKTPTTEIDKSNMFNPEKTLSEISVSQSPDKTIYKVKDQLDITGLKIRLKYSDGTTKTINSGFACTPTTLNTAGTQKVTVTYGGKTTSFNVTVTDTTGTALSVNSSNNAVISTGGTTKSYTFTPNESGTYVIYSTGSSDTKVYLYNSSGTQLSRDDDGGANNNFRLQYDLTAGNTYRFAVGYFYSSTGTIPFKFGKVYTVTYNANGGSGAPSSQSKDYGTAITLSSTTPKRTGYTFLGWSTSSSATSASYYAGGTYSSESNATLYAVWKKNSTTYTLSYNANGGSGAPSSQTGSTSYTISSTKPTRTGYTFLGWSKNSSATSASYQPGGSITISENTPLYAVWKANTYTIKYNANGGSGTMSNSIHTYDVSKALTSNAFKRSGYTFLGWSTSSSATSATYANGQSVKNLTSTNGGTVNLYAIWKKSGESLTVNSSNSAVISTSGTTKSYTFTPSESGTYVIYSTGSSDTKVYLYNSSGSQLSSNDDGGTNGDFRLQYNFTAGNTYRFAVGYYSSSKTGTIPFKFGKVYTITYNANGGSGAPSSQTKDYGTAITLSSTTPKRTGYTFLGWSTSSSATSATYSAGGTYSSESNATLYAVWKKNSTTYTLSYNANGGSGAPSSQTGSTSYTISSTKPTRTGYAFLGWSKSSSATTASYKPGDKITLTDNTTLYAVWEMIRFTLNTNHLALDYKSSAKIEPRISSGSIRTVEYESSNTSVATVDQDGNVTTIGTGTAEITVTATDNRGNILHNTCEVTVTYTWWQWLIVIFLFGWIWY